MENISSLSLSHSLPKKSYSSNANANAHAHAFPFSSHKPSVYDDVFGGPPKFGLPTLAPRFEDYAEIFGGFHSSRSSVSIPVLDLPIILDDDLEFDFDVRSPGFDYSEVFGSPGCPDFAASYEDLVAQVAGGYDCSDESWSAAQSQSLSDELDTFASSEKSNGLQSGDFHEALDCIEENIYYNKSGQRVTGDMSNVTAAQLSSFSGYTRLSNETTDEKKIQEEKPYLHVINNSDGNMNFGWRYAQEKRFQKCLSHPAHSGSSTCATDLDPSEKHIRSRSQLDKPFVSVSDISLRTKPSRLPPPARPPPALAMNTTEHDRRNPKLKASKSYAFERIDSSTSPSFFDVELNATPPAVASAEAKKTANDDAQATLNSTEDMAGRKKQSSKTHTTTHLEDGLLMEEKKNRAFQGSNCFREETKPHSHGKEVKASKGFCEENVRVTKKADLEADSLEGNEFHLAERSAAPVAWGEGEEFFEVDTHINRVASKTDKGENIFMRNMESYSGRHQRKMYTESPYQDEDSREFRMVKDAIIWDENINQLEMARDARDSSYNQGRSKATISFDKQQYQEKIEVGDIICKFDPDGSLEKLTEAWCKFHEEEAEHRPKAANGKTESERRPLDANKWHGNRKEGKGSIQEEMKEFQEGVEVEGNGEMLKGRLTQEKFENQQKKASHEVNKYRQKLADGRKDNEQNAVLYPNENEKRLTEAVKDEKSVRKSDVDPGKRKNQRDEQEACKGISNVRDTEACEQDNEIKYSRCFLPEGSDVKQEVALEMEEMERAWNDTSRREESEAGLDDAWRPEDVKISAETCKVEEIGERSAEICEMDNGEHLSGDPCSREKMSEKAECSYESNVIWDQENDTLMEEEKLKLDDEASVLEEGSLSATQGAKKHDKNGDNMTSSAAIYCGEHQKLKTETKSTEGESEIAAVNLPVREKFSSDNNKDDLQFQKSEYVAKNAIPNEEQRGNNIMTGCQFTRYKKETRDKITSGQAISKSVEPAKKIDQTSSVVSQNKESRLDSEIRGRNKNMERKDQKVNSEGQVEERQHRERNLEEEYQRKFEEEREREREREKDRMAVDRAALEARERSRVEVRERAERAAVERATAEVRQRAMAEARERMEKASMEARLRAERAAAERSTIEARQRALEKSLSEKATFGNQDRLERSTADRFSFYSRSSELRHSSYSSGLQDFQSAGTLSGLRYPYSSTHVGVDGESPQRCKARIERYQRTADRAAKALAEKNMRDLLAQREQEERNRVAEALDLEVKRWSSGKEGNLRALLSTLQYILGPDSGWQPIPLTEVITSTAVKKAYRKATLCVHPDKLQQRGANIQQKYISEKVFDLLKEAWNKFNSEER